MVHFQHTSLASTTVMCPIRLFRLTFLAKAHVTRRLYGQRIVCCRLRCRERRVTRGGSERGPRVGKNCGCVRPVKKNIQDDPKQCEEIALAFIVSISSFLQICSLCTIPGHDACPMPMFTSTHTAQLVKPYTNRRGK
jgi:hypothetical protein